MQSTRWEGLIGEVRPDVKFWLSCLWRWEMINSGTRGVWDVHRSKRDTAKRVLVFGGGTAENSRSSRGVAGERAFRGQPPEAGLFALCRRGEPRWARREH